MSSVLMFGWEFPPHISGGLGTACLGITEALIKQNVNVLFVVPKAYGDESLPVINASDVLLDAKHISKKNISESKSTIPGLETLYIPANVLPYGEQDSPKMSREGDHEKTESHISDDKEISHSRSYNFKGGYGTDLMHEVEMYSAAASEIARTHSFDIIHAHDWFTFPAGISAKKVSGKPLVVQVHSTEFDRAGAHHINPYVYEIEKSGMHAADKIVAVSNWTKSMLINRYDVPAEKIVIVHNGLKSRGNEASFFPRHLDYVVTYLGRVTFQKGPGYFLEAAKKVLKQLPQVHFVMAGAGDLLPTVIEEIARSRMGTRFHFTGFLHGAEIDELWSMTDVYVMPSVSEPFGITPLEAIHAGVPVIVSKQSGVSEVLNHAIKADFWDTEALANSIVNVLKYKSLSDSMKLNSRLELSNLTWENAVGKLLDVYEKLRGRQ